MAKQGCLVVLVIDYVQTIDAQRRSIVDEAESACHIDPHQ
jgi:hypothetical protein